MEPNHPNYGNSPPYNTNTNTRRNSNPQNFMLDPNHPNFLIAMQLLQNSPDPNYIQQGFSNPIPSVMNNSNLFGTHQATFSQNLSPEQSSFSPQPSQGFRIPSSSQQFSHHGEGSRSTLPITNLGNDDDDIGDDQGDDQIENNVVNSPSKAGKSRSTREKPITWNEAEDEALTSAYLEGGGDTTKGTDKKRVTHWAIIYNLYKRAQKENPGVIRPRSLEACASRFKRLSFLCNKFSAVMREAIENPKSGENGDDVMTRARRLFKEETKLPFTWDHVWNILKVYPKWDYNPERYSRMSESGGSSKRSEPETPTSEDVEMAARPPGIKKMKNKGMSHVSSPCSVDGIEVALREMNSTRVTEHGFDVERFQEQKEMFDFHKQLAEERRKEKEMRRKEKEERKRREDQLLEENRRREERQNRFTIYSILLAKPNLTPREQEQFEKLYEEFKV